MSDRFKFIHNSKMLSLEECCGPFNSLLNRERSVVPMPGKAMVFFPSGRFGASWDEFEIAIKEGYAYQALLKNDAFLKPAFPQDTTDREGFSSPSIFISYSFLDFPVVEKVINALFLKRQKYFLYTSTGWKGIGRSPEENSAEAVRKAEAVIVVLSEHYIDRFRGNPDGPLATEFFEFASMHRNSRFPVHFLTVDSHEKVIKALPFKNFGWKEPPFMGRPLKRLKFEEIKAAVGEIILQLRRNDGDI